MSHPAQLIAKIRTLLESEYPADLYRYQIEKSIPGTRMLPDILITTDSGQMQCAVEIGYTRPEKLTAYRKIHKIPDVRWYDKQGNLHADVTEKTVRVRLTAEPRWAFTTWVKREIIPCLEDECAILPDPESDSEGFAKGYELAKEDVVTFVITDYWFIWIVCVCLKCGTVWLSSPEEEGAWEIVEDFKRFRATEIARHYEKATRGGWNELASAFSEAYGFALEYECGSPLKEGTHNTPQMAIQAIRVQETDPCA